MNASLEYFDGNQRDKVKKKGGDLPPFFPLRFRTYLMHADFDLPRLGSFRLRNAYLEDTVFVGSFDAVLFHSLRQGERAPELCADPFYRAVLKAVSRLLRFTFAAEHQCPVLHLHFDIFPFHTGKLSMN